jgi:hypothetical protein
MHMQQKYDEYCENVVGLRWALNAGLQSIGLLAAFMTSLSVSLPSPNACMEVQWLHAEIVLSWISMGCFFLFSRP